jgi:hypothetical protein
MEDGPCSFDVPLGTREEERKPGGFVSEPEAPRDEPVFNVSTTPHWSRRLPPRIALGSLLALAGSYVAYRALQALGVRDLVPVFLIVLIPIVIGAVRWVLGPSERVSPAPGDGVVFSSAYRQVRSGVVTDDMSITIPADWNMERLVAFVLAAARRRATRSEVVSGLVASGFSEDDVLVAIDRTLGGLFRSRFRSSANRPSRAKDPVAWMAYHHGLAEPALVDAIFPASSSGGDAPGPTLEWIPPELSAFRDMTIEAPRLDKARALVAARLSNITGTWTVGRGRVLGPDGLSVLVSKDRCGGDRGGLLLGFVVPRARSKPVTIWDCAHGAGRTEEDVLRMAVERWARSTAPVGLELHNQRGKFADHFHGADGLPGWHVIQCAVVLGGGEGAMSLREWIIAHPLLPQLAVALEAAGLPVAGPTGMKLFFGSSGGKDLAEVRVNHVVHPGLSGALAGLTWPRSEDPAHARVFVLFVHRH